MTAGASLAPIEYQPVLRALRINVVRAKAASPRGAGLAPVEAAAASVRCAASWAIKVSTFHQGTKQYTYIHCSMRSTWLVGHALLTIGAVPVDVRCNSLHFIVDTSMTDALQNLLREDMGVLISRVLLCLFPLS